jgi:hypothetical protein
MMFIDTNGWVGIYYQHKMADTYVVHAMPVDGGMGVAGLTFAQAAIANRSSAHDNELLAHESISSLRLSTVGAYATEWRVVQESVGSLRFEAVSRLEECNQWTVLMRLSVD